MPISHGHSGLDEPSFLAGGGSMIGPFPGVSCASTSAVAVWLSGVGVPASGDEV
jgi:hypothetical protein